MRNVPGWLRLGWLKITYIYQAILNYLKLA